MALSAADRNAISLLNRSHVASTLQGLKLFAKNGRWLGLNNRYAIDTVKRIDSDIPLGADRSRNLAQYISASAVLHVQDGWSYLGRAIACLLKGDARRSLHLAYYAELRAAMGLLASSGIGVFNHKHFGLDAKNSTKKLACGNGTHVAAWDALDDWSQLPSSAPLLTSVVKPGGVSLDDWFAPLGGSLTLNPHAKEWFLQWGMDLRLAVDDRRARNDSSYRPDGIPHTGTLPPAETVQFVIEIWRLLEPDFDGSFGLLDQHILRQALEAHYRGKTGLDPVPGDAGFVRLITSTVERQNLSGKIADRWVSFLSRSDQVENPILFDQAVEPPRGIAEDVFGVIARSVLLLRVATGSAKGLLSEANFRKPDLEFWWSAIGKGRALWDDEFVPDALADLWADVSEALEDLTDLEDDPEFPNMSLYRIQAVANGRFDVLSSHERVGLWGICPT